MKIAGVDFSEQILLALRDKRLVIFAGAGVSMGAPACLPDFEGLADKLKEDTGLEREKGESVDRFLGRLKRNGTELYKRTAKILSTGTAPTDLHFDLLRLHGDVENVRIVTTNFDLLFEEVAKSVFQDKQPEVFIAPALPLGNDFRGIVHIHGSVQKPEQMVLTDSDFGHAYLTEGWARRFLIELFREFTVLFVGYSHEDVLMKYLSLSIENAQPRFALTDDKGDWQHLYITPIVYPKSSDYSALYEAIKNLVLRVNRGILDWKKEIEDIAGSPPPILEEESIDFLKEGLRESDRVKFFTMVAKSPEWIDWLDKNKYLDNLFLSADFSKRDQLFAQWLVDNFIVDHAEKLQLLIGERGMYIHPDFFWILGREIAMKRDISDDLLLRWVSLLLNVLPPKIDSMTLQWLAERCATQNLIEPLVEIFFVLLKFDFSIVPDSFAQMVDNDSSVLDIRGSPRGESYALNEAWGKIKPYISQIAVMTLRRLVVVLEKEYIIEASWQKAGRDWSRSSYNRSAIEPHEQDGDWKTDSKHILINAARDCLEELAKNKPTIAAGWCEQLIEVDTPLLRRLAVHTLYQRNDLTADEKLNWLLDNTDIHEVNLHHEMYTAVRKVYPEAKLETKNRLIQEINKYKAYESYKGDKRELEASAYLNWFDWLLKSDPSCEIAEETLQKVNEQFPNMKPRDYQDFTHWMETGDKAIEGYPRLPWGVDDLISQPIDEWLEPLLNYNTRSIYSASEERGFLIRDLVEKSIERSFELAQALAEKQKWDVDLWGSLITVWGEKADLSDENHRNSVLDFLEKEELHRHHQLQIARFLCELVENGGKEYAPAILDRLNGIGENLLKFIKDEKESASIKDVLSGEEDGRENEIDFHRIYEHSGSQLALFFVNSISIWCKSLEEKPKQITDQYRSILVNMIKKSLWSVAVLAGQFSFLQYVDKKWAEDCLLPSFDREVDVKKYKAAWSGFLFWGRLSPDLEKSLSPMFLKAVEHIEKDFVDNKDRFIDFYVAMIFYFIDKPLAEWIPKFFHSSNLKSKCYFAQEIGSQLRGVDESKIQESWNRWLRQYWENRLSGIPVNLTPEEAGCMVQWIGHLDKGGLFPKAVELAVQMPSAEGFIGHLLDDISTGEQASLYPEDTAKLLIYLGTAGSDTQIGLQRYAPEIIQKLPLNQLPSNLARGIEELKVKFSLN